MPFPSTSRGKKIVALIDKRNNSPNEVVTPDETSNNEANQTSHEMRNLSNECNSSSSSSSDSDSSTDSDSSDDTFIEDSDDSVKDPMYIPPEPLLQQNSAELRETSEDLISVPSTSTADRLITISEPCPLQRSAELPVEQTSEDSIATNNLDSIIPLPLTSMENRNITSSPASPKAKQGRKRKRNEANWIRNVKKMLRNLNKNLIPQFYAQFYNNSL